MLLRIARDVYVISDVFFGLYLLLVGSGEIIGVHTSVDLFDLIFGVGVLILALGMFVSAAAVAQGLPWQGRLRTLLYSAAPMPYAYLIWSSAWMSEHWEWSFLEWFILISLANLVTYRIWLRYKPFARA